MAAYHPRSRTHLSATAVSCDCRFIVAVLFHVRAGHYRWAESRLPILEMIQPRPNSRLLLVHASWLSLVLGASPAVGQSIDLARVGHDRGDARAKISIVEFADFGCSYCAQFARETLPPLEDEYIKPGRVRWKFIPFVIGSFPNSREAAEAAECAGEQGKFFEMHDLLFARRRDWLKSKNAPALLAAYADSVGVNRSQFAACRRLGQAADRIRRNDALAERLALRGTPTFFVEGYRVPGAIPIDVFRQVLAELEKGSGRTQPR